MTVNANYCCLCCHCFQIHKHTVICSLVHSHICAPWFKWTQRPADQQTKQISSNIIVHHHCAILNYKYYRNFNSRFVLVCSYSEMFSLKNRTQIHTLQRAKPPAAVQHNSFIFIFFLLKAMMYVCGTVSL